MLDGTEYFECDCGAAEHTLRLIVDESDNTLTVEFLLQPALPWWQRVYVAVRYVFGRGARNRWLFDSWTLREQDAERLLLAVRRVCTRYGVFMY